jgi:hypothetical protein
MSLKAHAPRRPEQFRPDLAALAGRANLARRKARPRTRLGFHIRLELSKSHFAAVHESGIRTFETCRRTVTMSVIGVERKLSVRGQADAIDPERTSIKSASQLFLDGKRRNLQAVLHPQRSPTGRLST